MSTNESTLDGLFRKLLVFGAVLISLSVPAALGAWMSPAKAIPSGVWVPAISGVPLNPYDTIDVGGSLTLTYTFYGIPGIQVECTFPLGMLGIVVPNPTPEAVPGGSLHFEIDHPGVLSSIYPYDFDYGRCTDNYTGDATFVYTNQVAWAFDLDVPIGTGPSPDPGPLNGLLTLPLGAMKIQKQFTSCEVGIALSGGSLTTKYDSGVLTPSPVNQMVPAAINWGTCTVGTNAAVELSFDFDPAFELVYVP